MPPTAENVPVVTLVNSGRECIRWFLAPVIADISFLLSLQEEEVEVIGALVWLVQRLGGSFSFFHFEEHRSVCLGIIMRL